MNALSLYSLEDTYLSLIDTEGAVPAEQEAEFKEALAVALKSAVAKRDAVGQFILHCEAMAEASRAEQKRLAARAKTFDNAAERLKSYVLGIIEAGGTDEKGKYRKLDGNTVSLIPKANPASVEITDIEAVPSEYKTLTFSVPAVEWDDHIEGCREMIGSLPLILLAISKPSVSVDKAALAKALKSGAMVPGCDLKTDSMRLEVK